MYIPRNNAITAYKVFNSDWTCQNNYQFEIGKEYKQEGKIVACNNGFHSCKKIIDCFSYYDFNPKNKVAMVKIWGCIDDSEKNKIASQYIFLEKEINWHEVLDLVNSGYCNSGNRNSGNINSGNRNSGDWNSGSMNSGNRNSGDWNSGYCNSGNRNSGYCNSGGMNSGDWNSGSMNSGNRNSGDSNSGNMNSGYCNSGDMNSGDWNSGDMNSGNRNSGDSNSGNMNSGDWNSGCFNSNTPDTIQVFNNHNVGRDAFYSHPAIQLCYKFTIRFYRIKQNGKKFHRQHTYKQSWQIWYGELNRYQRKVIYSMKKEYWFEPDVWEEITGLNIEKFKY